LQIDGPVTRKAQPPTVGKGREGERVRGEKRRKGNEGK